MIDLTKMQSHIDKLMRVFTKLVEQLNQSIQDLDNAIKGNTAQIVRLRSANDEYTNKIVEYEKLKTKIENLIK